MSFLARNALRGAIRSRARGFASEVPTQTKNAYVTHLEAVEHHAAETTELWRKISYYVCIPAIAVCSAWVYNLESEHKHHIDHLIEENGGEYPQPPAYEYLNIRRKPFPWGMNSLFFNPEVQRNLEEE
ncbi:cytochrome c oxidase subunit via [Moniliophthora roreri MCA 2997]|uniref:Cytochrome c oxidase subunit 13, mitochondrial n=1 Tax=Moniliophthora roreri (strain MCA 2997) TaxID=1381753 RepID=V2XZM7_MONRO|nr:cytochrome c oxidase subunit via [Moniliophthora roreri MCA 2997]